MTAKRILQSGAAIGLLILTLGGMAAVAGAPFFQLARLDADIVSLKRELAQLSTRGQDVDRLRQENEALVASGQSAGLLLEGETTGIAGANLQRQITDLVTTHGGTATSLQVLPPSAESDMTRIALSLNISVGIDGLQGFLYALEAGEPLMFIDDILIRSGQSEFEKPDPHLLGPLDVSLQVSAFTAKKEETP